ncbi:hypothetical protein XFLM_05030 [Xylella fastidiosa subsp. fastidiosa GB514]|nr:hypothetical protein XFLM_05030 [Xylella fastidiosa subsp. fastidiosa GB514]KAF0571545.1 hypothetical protein P305_03865 [Xylella fastidiosa subsp. fastidiosa Mus-1]
MRGITNLANLLWGICGMKSVMGTEIIIAMALHQIKPIMTIHSIIRNIEYYKLIGNEI